MTIEVNGPPEEEQQFQAPDNGTEMSSLDQMQEKIYEQATEFGGNPGETLPTYEKTATEESALDDPRVRELHDDTKRLARLRALEERGRYGVQSEGNERKPTPDIGIKNSEMTPEEERMVHAATRELLKDDIGAIQKKSKERIASPSYWEMSSDARKVDISGERDRHTEDRIRLQEQIRTIRNAAHEMYERDPERYKNMSVHEFLGKKEEFDKDIEALHTKEQVARSLGKLSEWLESIDLENVSNIWQLHGEVNNGIVEMFSELNESFRVLDTASRQQLIEYLGTQLGDAMFGDTVFDNDDDIELATSFQYIPSKAEDSDSDKVKIMRVAESVYGDDEGYTRIDGYSRLFTKDLFGYNPHKSPVQLTSELTGRMQKASSSVSEETIRVNHEFAEKWGAKPEEKQAA